MCYNNPPCGWFWFSPLTGKDGCKKPEYADCPADLEEEEEEEDYQDEDDS